MKTSPFPYVLAVVWFSTLPGFAFSQHAPLDQSAEAVEECGGYAPFAFFHVATNVEGLRLRRRPAKDAPVLAALPKNTRLIWQSEECGDEFEATFNDGIPRKGRWAYVDVWKGGGQYGWVFSGALTLIHIQYDAEFGGGLECLDGRFVTLKPIDSLDFVRRFALSGSKREKIGSSPMPSPDGKYSIRQLTTREDKMAGLEFSIQLSDGAAQKVTLEMIYGNHVRKIAWAAASAKILLEWADEEAGKVYYEMDMPVLNL
ncbi:MAG: SH3 domain-containing protein [Saprospiraceae bacterium]|nr:SH3 domain-containing protein [Saprospiraceae bacterium]